MKSMTLLPHVGHINSICIMCRNLCIEQCQFSPLNLNQLLISRLFPISRLLLLLIITLGFVSLLMIFIQKSLVPWMRRQKSHMTGWRGNIGNYPILYWISWPLMWGVWSENTLRKFHISKSIQRRFINF